LGEAGEGAVELLEFPGVSEEREAAAGWAALADSAAEPPVLLLVQAKSKALESNTTPVTLVNTD
jgi:hypothetical protein